MFVGERHTERERERERERENGTNLASHCQFSKIKKKCL